MHVFPQTQQYCLLRVFKGKPPKHKRKYKSNDREQQIKNILRLLWILKEDSVLPIKANIVSHIKLNRGRVKMTFRLDYISGYISTTVNMIMDT